MLFYVLVSEVLGLNIRCSPRFSGISLPGLPPMSLMSRYADDTSLILSSDDSIKAAFEKYGLYEKASGSKLNCAKSKGLWLRTWRGRSDPTVDLDGSSVKLKVLGVFIGINDLDEDNWQPCINAVVKVLSSSSLMVSSPSVCSLLVSVFVFVSVSLGARSPLLVYSTGASVSPWQKEGAVLRLMKDLFVTFWVDTIVNTIHILSTKASVDIDDISSIQCRVSDRSWVVSFCKAETKEFVMELPYIFSAGVDVFLWDAANCSVLVKIYKAPQELPDSITLGICQPMARFCNFGMILS